MSKFKAAISVDKDAWEAFVHLARAMQHQLAAWDVIARHVVAPPAPSVGDPSPTASAGGAAESDLQTDPMQTRTDEQSPPAARQ